MRITLEDIPPSPEVLEAFLEAMTALNTAIIHAQQLPSVYDVARYRREPRGREQWWTASRIVREGYDDCEGLSCYRAAELRVYDGEPARVTVIPIRRGLLHAVVQRADGSIEDIARALGMRGKG